MKKFMAALLCVPWLIACSPEVGTERWCESMKEKPKGEWTANEVSDYTKNCVFSSGDE